MGKMNKKGFTLAELLIVIAIMAVLLAVAIPVFSSQLEKARHSVDQNTERAAKSLAEAHYLLEHASSGSGIVCTFTKDGDNLEIKNCSVCGDLATTAEVTAVCQCTDATEHYKGKTLKVTVSSGGEVTGGWVDSTP